MLVFQPYHYLINEQYKVTTKIAETGFQISFLEDNVDPVTEGADGV